MEGFADAPKRRGPSATDEERKACAERPLAEGASIRQAAKDAGVNRETSRRYAREGLIETVPTVSPDAAEGEEIAVEDQTSLHPCNVFEPCLARFARFARFRRSL